MEQGRIIKGIGGFYYVQLDGGLVVECRARGRFRRDGKPPLVGDLVTILPQREGVALVDEILPRKNELVRPMAANVDRLLLVLSAAAPPPDWLLADKLLIQAHCAGIAPLLLLNKCDAANRDTLDAFLKDYASFDTLCVSAKTGQGIRQLGELLQEGVSCFAGQSAVGKTSLLNALIPGLSLETAACRARRSAAAIPRATRSSCPLAPAQCWTRPGSRCMIRRTLNRTCWTPATRNSARCRRNAASRAACMSPNRIAPSNAWWKPAA